MMKSKLILICAAGFFAVSIAIVFGRPLVAALITESRLESTAPRGDPRPVSSGTRNGTPESSGGTPQDSFEEQLRRLRTFREAGTLADLLNEGDEIERKWGRSGGNEYGHLFLEFLSVLSSRRYADDVGDRCRDLTTRALKKADTFDLEIEWSLLLFLGAFDRDVRLSELERGRRRNGTHLWLHAIRRLERAKDQNFDPDDLPSLSVTPPAQTGLPAGVDPEVIHDPELRAEYQRHINANSTKLKYFGEQLAIRRQEKFFVERGIEYIAKAYSLHPRADDELETLFREFDVSKPVQESIRAEILSRRSQP